MTGPASALAEINALVEPQPSQVRKDPAGSIERARRGLAAIEATRRAQTPAGDLEASRAWDEQEVWGRSTITSALIILGRHQEALLSGHEALRAARDRGSELQVANILGMLGSIYSRLGEYESSLEAHEEGLAIWRRQGTMRGVAIKLAGIGVLHAQLGDDARAIAHYEEAIRLCLEVDWLSDTLAGSWLNAGISRRILGDLDGALEDIDRAVQGFLDLERPPGAANALLERGLLYLDRGDLARARSDVEAALALLSEGGLELYRAAAHRALAQLDVAEGRLPEARAGLVRGLEILPAEAHDYERVEILRALADVEERLGDPASALGHLREGHALELKLAAVLSERRLIASRVRGEVLAAQAETRRERAMRERLAQANARLEALDREKDALLGIAAHDLRSGLSAIGLSAAALQATGGPADAADVAARIERVGDRMRSIIDQVLGSSALDSGARTLSIGAVSPIDVALAVADEHAARADVKGIRLRLLIDEAAPDAAGDEVAVAECVGNYVSNAIKFSAPGGLVELSCDARDAELLFWVDDDGPGLSEVDRDRAFSKFATLTARPTGGEASIGLGLSIVKRLAEAMGGRVWCGASPLGGARFGLALPRWAPDVSASG